MSSLAEYLKKYSSKTSTSKKKRPSDSALRARARERAATRVVDLDERARASSSDRERDVARERIDVASFDARGAVVLDRRGREIANGTAIEDVERVAAVDGARADGSGWRERALDGNDDRALGRREKGRARKRYDSDSEGEIGARKEKGREFAGERARARDEVDGRGTGEARDLDGDDFRSRGGERTERRRNERDLDVSRASRADVAEYDSDGDLIIPGRVERLSEELKYDSDGDLIIPGKVERLSEELKYDSDGDLMVSGQIASLREDLRYDSDGDLIVPAARAAPSAERRSSEEKKRTTEKGSKMTDGGSTGLVSAAQVIMEAEIKRKAEQQRLANMSAEQSGRGAATNYRDKSTGKLIDDEEIKRRAQMAKPKERERPVWTSGVEQARQALQYARDLEKAKDTPFAHADIDADFEGKQREAMRFGDPMAHLSRKKRENEALNLPPVLEGLGFSMEDLKKSGFKIPQEVPAHSWLRQGIGAPHNRYQIKPGRHWDGVDRGTGFENKMFKKKDALKDRARLMETDLEEHNEWF